MQANHGAAYLSCRDDVIALLLKIFTLGLKDAPREDLEDMLLALRVLRRDALPIDLGEVRLHIRGADWIGAVRLLKRLEWAEKANTASIALLAGCLFKLNDSEWRRYASKVLRDGGNPAALALVGKFMQLDETARPVHEVGGGDELRTRIADVVHRGGGPSAF
ncbi:HrpB1 family type III secretion system apparatus protein [Paraburkholderia sp. BCC1885]|uniref:HrpB1 family type III secretion system apparatus protein n=1 Tax=Paraburkholderia sp. BCC1885 TaxID=2562669 RepID=UPI0011824DD3|nr:HrpB1 family type III secretion system apparatus protein [Paraburkholderia sp. BCC1885]